MIFLCLTTYGCFYLLLYAWLNLKGFMLFFLYFLYYNPLDATSTTESVQYNLHLCPNQLLIEDFYSAYEK